MLDVNAASGTGEMTLLREMKITTDQDYSWSGEDRSVIHGNNIFYVHGNQIWQSLWQADAAINGPY
jgi:CRISPR/Cas system-associated protein Cas7 (RAMP superfamily)